MLTTLSHRAMATEFAVYLAAQNAHLADSALQSLEMLDQIEAELTIYDESSSISRVNSRAASAPVSVSEPIFTLLRDSIRWSEETNGAFDITAGPLVRVWGFTDRKGRKPAKSEVDRALERVGYQNLLLDQKNLAVQFLAPEMEINLGAIGKGYALDCLAENLIANGVNHFLIHGGASSVLARGDQVEGSGRGWAVGIAHPTKSNVRLGGFWLKDQALSTSGSGKQFFHHRGKRFGHVIDPRTGYPAGDLLSLTAVADRATDAEAASTGYYVWGIEELRQVVKQGNSVRMIAVRLTGRKDDVEVISLSDFEWIDTPFQSTS